MIQGTSFEMCAEQGCVDLGIELGDPAEFIIASAGENVVDHLRNLVSISFPVEPADEGS